MSNRNDTTDFHAIASAIPVFQHIQANDFGATLGDLVPTLTGERE